MHLNLLLPCGVVLVAMLLTINLASWAYYKATHSRYHTWMAISVELCAIIVVFVLLLILALLMLRWAEVLK